MTDYKPVTHEPDHIPDAGKKVSDQLRGGTKKIGRRQIREAFLRNGAHIEPGHDDLPDYVYESVFELMEMAAVKDSLTAQGVQVGAWAVFASNGNIRAWSERRDHPTLVTLEAEGATVVRLSGAPAVQGEPVGWQLRTPEGRVILNKEFPAWADGGDGYKITPLYTAPQPAEQQPCPEDIREGAPYDDPAFESLCREHEIWSTAAAAQCSVFWEAGKRVAEQKAATDVAGLVEALEYAIETLDDCDMNLFHNVIEVGGAALAAHRKGANQ